MGCSFWPLSFAKIKLLHTGELQRGLRPVNVISFLFSNSIYYAMFGVTERCKAEIAEANLNLFGAKKEKEWSSPKRIIA